MPELPEVEVQRRTLLRWMKGRRVVAAEADATRVFRGADRGAFRAIRGPLRSAERKGKYLLLHFEDTGLLSHLGMTGKWVRRPGGVAEPYSRARLTLDSGDVLHYRDPRLFGRLEPVPVDALPALPAVRALGRDPLVDGLDWRQLKDAVAPSKQALKVALMDQGRIAGLGNIHAAEALYRAGLHPARAPGSLRDDEWKALAKGIHAALTFALDHEQGEEIVYVEEPGAQNPFLVYGRQGEACRRCRKRFESMVQGGRTTHFCPGCQPRRGRTHRP